MGETMRDELTTAASAARDLIESLQAANKIATPLEQIVLLPLVSQARVLSMSIANLQAALAYPELERTL